MIPQAPTPRGYHFRDVQLELSLKPFWDDSAATRAGVCEELFLQWLPLCRFADSVSIMLWIGDGSEILEYEGDAGASFAWGSHHGAANPISWHAAAGVEDKGDPDHDAIGHAAKLRDPERRGVHLRAYDYRPDPAIFTYGWLAGLVDALKETGTRITGKKILVGTTFDIGPEFAVSRFKYEWHPEICGGGSLFGGKFIRCDALLHADSRRYAGFPNGFAEGTTVGTFLGRQCRHFFADCGFDFIWFSNGFGFAMEPWALTGAVFDGSTFHAEKGKTTAGPILKFWNDFRVEMPDLPVRTRGTNLTTGIDLGSDASPLREIYAQVPHVEPPVNSPWAALDGDVGLELAGWMSHIARTPGRGYRFRYYIHDPWWLNSPWLDRYQRQPFDIYLPLSVSRLLADGSVEPPSDVAFLSVDDSHGHLPPTVPVEVISHVLHAREFMPDAIAPVVWAYPFDAYHTMVTGDRLRPDAPFFGDWFVRGLIAHGVPVNTVADTVDLAVLLGQNPRAIRDSILIAPALPGQETEALVRHAESGGRVFFYGPLDECDSVRDLFQLGLESALEGDFVPVWDTGGRRLRHVNLLSAGGWSETPGANPGTHVAILDGRQRAASALHRFPGGGCVGWVRGSLATAEFDPAHPAPINGPRLEDIDSEKFIFSEDLARQILSRMGLSVEIPQASSRLPIVTIHRHANAFVFSGYQSESAVPVRLGLTQGAPLFPGLSNSVKNGHTEIKGPPSWHHVCRAFVVQEADGDINCRIIPPIQHGYTERLLLSGLENATVRFFPVPGTRAKLEILHEPLFPYFVGNFLSPKWEDSPSGLNAVLEHIDGELLFSW